MAEKVTPVPRLEEDRPVVQPPSTLTVEYEHKPRLYTADGKPLIRRAGY